MGVIAPSGLKNPFEVPYDASAIKKELRAARRLAERVKQNEKEISKLKAELNDLKSLKTKINSHSNKLSELGEEMKTLSKRKSANTSPLFLPSEEEVSEWEKDEDTTQITTGKDGKNQCTFLPSSPLYDYSLFSSASTAKSNADENMFAIGVSSTEQEQSDDEHEKYVPTTKSKDYTTKKNKEEESRGQSSKKPLTTSKKKRK